MLSVIVSPVGKLPSFARGLPTSIKVPGEDSTIADIKQSIAAKFPKVRVSRSGLLRNVLSGNVGTKFYASRQKITLKGDRKILPDHTTLNQAGIVDGSELLVKDLGPQISWRVVFLVEYVCALS